MAKKPSRWWIFLAGLAVLGLVTLLTVDLLPLRLLLALIAVEVIGAVVLWFTRPRRQREGRAKKQPAQPKSKATPAAPALADTTAPPQPLVKPKDTRSLVERMLGQGRYALLLRPEIRSNLSTQQLERACAALEADMSLSEGGEAVIDSFADFLEDDYTDRRGAERQQRMVFVDDFYLDRLAVTNRQFLEFVNDGGYQDETLWNPEIWPAVANFLDTTDCSGPRHWKQGTHPKGEDDLPVVGISWYEADAYARWVGKRLPTDAEWEKAAGCPVRVGGGKIVQRRYPWGDSMDRNRANVWGSGPGRIVAVGEYAAGACSGGVRQLIGNVWEWTSAEFDPTVDDVGLRLPTPLKSLRGGAFDTYFDNQSTSQFQSGENPMARKHNVGFRCALSLADLEGDDHDDDEGRETMDHPSSLREVTA